MRTNFIQKISQYLDLKTFFINLAIFVLYLLAGKLGLSVAFGNSSASAIWPPTGIALASIIIFGNRVIPAIFLGAFLVNVTTTGVILTSLGIALGNTLEGILGAFLVNRFCNGIKAFDTVLSIFKFIILAGLISTAVGASIGVFVLIFGNLATWQEFASVWLTWWLGDTGGNLVVAPLILVWATHTHYGFNLRHIIKLFFSFLSLLIVLQVVFTGLLPEPYLCIPFGVWIAFEFGRRGATVATILVATIAAYYTLGSQGPFAVATSLNHSLILLLLFLATFSITVLIFATNILQIRNSEKAIAERDERFKALIENSFDGVVLIDATSKILYASPSVKRVLGYTPEELYGMRGFDLIYSEDRPYAMTKLAELVLNPSGTVTIEYRSLRKDGRRIWVEATGTNLLLEPSVNAVVVNFHDITQSKASEEKLLQEKLTDEAMLGSIGDGVIATDEKGNITVINEVACESLGWERNEILHQSIVKAVPMVSEDGKIIPLEERPMTKVLTLGKEMVTSQTTYYLRKDKSKLPVYFTVTPIVLGGKTVGTIEVFRDITREKQVDRAKSEFVSIASHQLRTPLTIINWYLERLMKRSQSLTEKDKGYLEEVYHASKRMVDLINSLLNVSRLELGTFVVEPKMVDIFKIAEDVLQDFKPQVEKKSIRIEKKFHKGLSLISADPRLMTMIFQNLISNAIKYSKEGGKIDLQVSLDQQTLMIRVTDRGLGISKSEQAKVFSKLFRADNARAVEPEGTGLGLYIVKNVVAVSGGKITFNSEENKGTTFEVTFPMSGMNQPKAEVGSAVLS